VATYDPKNIVAIWGIPLAGFAPDSFITVAWQSEGAQMFAGARGDAVTVYDHNQNAEVTFRLMATGAGRNVLAALGASLNLGGPPLPFQLISPDTGETWVCAQAVLKRAPAAEYATGAAPVREITLLCPKMSLVTVPDPSVLG